MRIVPWVIRGPGNTKILNALSLAKNFLTTIEEAQSEVEFLFHLQKMEVLIGKVRAEVDAVANPPRTPWWEMSEDDEVKKAPSTHTGDHDG